MESTTNYKKGFFLKVVIMKVHKDTPLAELTLRKYERPYDMKKRDLLKRLMLSIGLLQPGDSRDVIVDVFQVIFEGKGLTATEVEKKVAENREKHGLQLIGITPSNVRRQIRRLKDIFLIEKFQNVYRLTENMSLQEIFEEKIERFYLKSIVARVKEYVAAVDKK